MSEHVPPSDAGDAGSRATRARHELYEIMRDDGTFEEKARAALEVGKEFLGVENGHVTRIDVEADHWEIVASTDGGDDTFQPGMELQLGGTYCRRTIEEIGPIALHDAPRQGWRDDPAFRAHGLHCYHGTRLLHEGKLYGTVCFVAEDSRDEPFDDVETAFVESLARELEHALDHDHLEGELRRKVNLTNVLTRVLRHNLRNDIGVIRGRVELMREQPDDEYHGEVALRTIDRIISLVGKARQLDDIITDDAERVDTEMGGLVERIVERAREQYPSATFTYTRPSEDIPVAVFPSIDLVLQELLENAARHAGAAPDVDVAVERVPNGVELTVTDDGPGLPDQEMEVLETHLETSLVHSGGLGLWIVAWVTADHDGTLDATVSDEGTTVTVTIPRSTQMADSHRASKLERHKNIYESIFEGAFDGMYVLDEDVNIVEANERAADIFGMDRRKLIGRPNAQFLPHDFALEDEWERFEEEQRIRGTVTIQGADGVQRPVEYTAANGIAPNQHLIIIREMTSDGEHVADHDT